jgi:transcriptional regulator with XRE-family HTH domain
MTPNLRQIGERLKEYMQLRGLTITAVARMSKFSTKELDAMVEGGKYPVSRLMLLLSLFDDLNPHWLFQGMAPMVLRGNPKPKRELRDDLEARETLKRAGLHGSPPPAALDSAAQLGVLTVEIARLHEQVAELNARLKRLEEQTV